MKLRYESNSLPKVAKSSLFFYASSQGPISAVSVVVNLHKMRRGNQCSRNITWIYPNKRLSNSVM